MHIADGVLPGPVLLGGAVAALGLGAWSVRSLEDHDIPRTAVMTSAFFVASSLSVPLLGTSVHLTLIGLVGIVLGRAAFIATLVGVALQAALFQHGGLTVIGVNATVMGLGALLAARVFRLRGTGVRAGRDAWFAALAAALGTLTAALLHASVLLTAGSSFRVLAAWALGADLALVAIESTVAFFAVRFLAHVEPRLLRPRPSASESASDAPPRSSAT